MKTRVIYSTGYGHTYSVTEAIIPQSGKWIDVGNWKPRIASIVWGAVSKELLTEAAEINRLQSEVDAKRRVLNEKLRATQAAMLAQAKVAPKDPEPEPLRHIKITPEML